VSIVGVVGDVTPRDEPDRPALYVPVDCAGSDARATSGSGGNLAERI